jgi:hypothetical protein
VIAGTPHGVARALRRTPLCGPVSHAAHASSVLIQKAPAAVCLRPTQRLPAYEAGTVVPAEPPIPPDPALDPSGPFPRSLGSDRSFESLQVQGGFGEPSW